MSQLYKYIGVSRQAIDQYRKRQDVFDNKVICLLSEVEELRKEHPGCGVEKMFYSLNPDFIGRAVEHYNNRRIHNSLDRMSPAIFLKYWQTQTKENRKTVNIFNNELV